jgi:TolA-binding protein
MGLISLIMPKKVENLEDSIQKTRKPNHTFTDEDRERAEEKKRLNAELKKQEFELKQMELEINAMERKQELEIRKEELKQLREEFKQNKDEGGDNTELMMMNLINQIMQKQQAPAQAPATQTPQMPVENPPEEPPYIPDSRFSDEQLKLMIPKLLNKAQIEAVKGLNLNDDEILQLNDVIKTM